MIEGDVAAVADGDLAVQHVLDSRKIRSRTGGVYIDEFVLARDGDHGLVGMPGSLGVEDLMAVEFDVVAGHAVIVHGGNRQRVGIGAGGTVCRPAYALGIGIAIGGILKPASGVARGHRNDGAALDDVLQNRLKGCIGITGETGVAAAERQVHGVCAENNGILNGYHVVGIIGAAALAEDLHGEHLCIRCDALRQNVCAVQRADIGAVTVRNIAVARRDTGDMGAMVALGIVVMGDIQIVVSIVVAEGDLRVDIQIRSAQCLIGLNRSLVDVQLLQFGSDVRHIHRGDAAVLHRVGVGIGIQRGMVYVRAGIDDGDLAAGAGVARGPGGSGADHLAGGRHVRIGCFGLVDHTGFILGLDENLLDACDLLNLFDLAVFYIGRDDVGSQSQVPDNVQRFAAQRLFGDDASQFLLLALQLLTVFHSTAVRVGNILRSKALFKG